MPSPRDSSLTFCPEFECEPYTTWRELATTANEYERLLRILHGVPREWIISAEQRARAAELRTKPATDRLAYRLQVLWSGIIHTQEGKFLCDLVENALRQSLVTYFSRLNIPCCTLKTLLRGYAGKQLRDACRTRGLAYDDTAVVSSDIVVEMTFNTLLVAYTSGWQRIPPHPGTSSLFGTEAKRFGRFRQDLRSIREFRNDIAHTKRLVGEEEVRRVYGVAHHWLTLLHVDVEDRIHTYRAERPRFLDGIG